MKLSSKSTLLPITALLLGACTQQNDSETKNTVLLDSPSKVSAKTQIIPPVGRWLVNQRHCQNTLDVRNVVDMNVVANGLTKGNVLIRGKWASNDGLNASPLIEQTLATDGNCLPVDINQLQYIQLNTESNEYIFASQMGAKTLFLVEKGEVKILISFDESLLSKYDLVDSLNERQD